MGRLRHKGSARQTSTQQRQTTDPIARPSMKNYRSTIVGFAALVVLLTAGAAQSLSGSNTVASDDIIDGQVYGPDIHSNAVTGAKVATNSLTGADINPARQTVVESWGIDAGQNQFGFAQCPAGKTATGGGFTQETTALIITDSFRDPEDASTWVVFATNPTTGELGLDVSVTCDAL